MFTGPTLVSGFSIGQFCPLIAQNASVRDCSGDSKYVLTGGEDDLVSLFSLEQQAVVAWGEGHTSYVRTAAYPAP